MAIAPNTKVRLKNNPARIGYTTTATRNNGLLKLIQVDYGTTKSYHAETLLEVVVEWKNPDELFKDGAFGTPEALRMAVIIEKLRGRITNMFYSMNVSAADFLPYQFKPVLKFIESMTGRILIADEVGLGKTIEAAYIWKELEARKDAKRLLILCPAVLREKWKHDLHKLFGIRAEIWDSKKLFEVIKEAHLDPYATFTSIVSIEAIRSKYDADTDEPVKSYPDKIARILCDQIDREADFNLFDLVIIDEAHYLRNQNTASNKTATLVRDNAEHLVLLSATPVQTSSNNLFQLLKLLAPDEYYDYRAFLGAVEENRPILDAIAAINNFKTTPTDIHYHYNNLQGLVDDTIRERMLSIYNSPSPNPQGRVDLSWRLSEYSYLNEHMNRTRKRDVQTNRVVRDVHAVTFQLTDFEKNIYDSISNEIREQISRSEKGAPFVLTLRQRHMASCLPMGVKAYKSSLEKTLEDYESEYYEEGPVDNNDYEFELSSVTLSDELVNELVEMDSKYKGISRSLRKDVFAYNPKEKIIIFSFFRTTVSYLEMRLMNEGYSVCLIKGGMGDGKEEVLEKFAKEDGPNILLSTEVGAEGLDLQFARVIINYDLPWNPMRVEQRIGRIDRIGQKSEKISIFNMICQNTVEDRVLERLYLRINIFKGTVGQLDEIIGNQVELLMLDVINKGLTQDQALDQAEATAIAIVTNQRDEETLEEQAINLLGFNDYIMQSIHDAKDHDRFVSPSDLTSFVDDFFLNHYPGSKVKERYRNEDVLRMVQLSDEARDSIAKYINTHPSPTRTRLASQKHPILCVFDPQYNKNLGRVSFMETLELKHPLIQWILSEYDKDPQAIYRCAVATIPQRVCAVPVGQYMFSIQRWESSGSVERIELKYFAKPIGDAKELQEREQEILIKTTIKLATKWENHSVEIDLDQASYSFDQFSAEITNKFSEYMESIRLDHKIKIQKQNRYAKSIRDRKTISIKERLEGLIANQKSQSIIKATQGQLVQIEENYQRQIRRINEKIFSPSFDEIAVGIIQVQE